MMASIGLVAQHYWKLPGFENLPSGFSILGTQEGLLGLFALFLVSGCLENTWREDPNGAKEPGNFGDPFGLQMYTQEMRMKELNLFSCIFSLQCAMKLCSTRKRCRNHISRCRFVKNQRKKVFHRLHRWNRMRWALLGLCLASPLVMMTIKASQYVSPMSTPTFPKGTTWCLSRKKRNQLTHSLVGNTVVSRTRWESTTEAPGIQLHAPEELALPGDAAPQELRASQVSNGAVGYSFCNQVELTPKLSVKGGSYLVLLSLFQELSAAISVNSYKVSAQRWQETAGKLLSRALTLQQKSFPTASGGDQFRIAEHKACRT